MGVKTEPRTQRPRRLRLITTARARAAAIVIGACVALLLMTRLLFQDPTFVDRLSVTNRSGYDVRVEVAAPDGTDWMPLRVAVQHCTTSIQLVIDPGSTWRFRFHAQGVDGGEEIVTRAELERAGWTLQIPDAVESQLATRAAPLPPPQTCIGETRVS